MPKIQPPDRGDHTTGLVIECDAIGCRELADYRIEGLWASDDSIRLFVCLVHAPWAIKELRAYRIYGRAPRAVKQAALEGNE
jgi:hypothetical protein